MADDSLVNGGAAAADGEDQAAESFYDFETSTTTKVSDLVKKAEALERERGELVKENEEVKEEVRKWEAEVLGLRSEKERMVEVVRRADEDGKALGAIAGRAADLETEVFRLQHDLASAMSEGDEANAELREARKELEAKTVSIAELEKEKEALKERFSSEVEEAKKAKAVVEAKVIELENKVQEIGDEVKAELAVKESEIRALKKKATDLEAEIANGKSELDKEKAEQKALQEALKASEARVAEHETKLILLQKRVEEAEKVISLLKETTVEACNGVVDRDAACVDQGSIKGMMNLQWAAAAGAAAALIVGGVICLHYARRR